MNPLAPPSESISVTEMPQSFNREPVSRPQVFQVPFHGSHLWLVIDDNGVKWTPVAQIACILALPLGDTLTRMDNNPSEFRHARLDVPPILVGGSAVCLRMEHLHHFLRSGFQEKHVSRARLPMLQHLRAEACDVLNSFQPEEPKAKVSESLPSTEPAKPSRAGLMTVDFHGAPLLLVEKDGQPFVAMKNVVEGMGLDWNGQHKKLIASPRWTISMTEMVAQDGKKRDLVCMPLRKLAGWLSTIQPSRVKPELQDRILTYQNECDDALWDYWTKGYAANPRAPKASRALPRLSGALIVRLREQVGFQGATEAMIRMWPEWFANLPGPLPQGPQQVVQPSLGLER